MKTGKSGIARKLEEFGWLWKLLGGDEEWHFTPVKIQFATVAKFDAAEMRDPHKIAFDVWVYGLNQEGVPTLRYGQCGWKTQLGKRTLEIAKRSGHSSSISTNVKYVAMKNMTGGIAVYRPPEGKTFWQFLQRYDTEPKTE